ncbi:anti-repressor SinI family protein [Ferviditalea candida]|uniref:Anti-repressor SinI family protein n=1 Tax=Ferviditalea candida TaxID=3108399 RepID=A0ABU5ZEZ5_9BACL|nr:anti-repressor SinI family protein [Paenibacillaceae bacterium T2]
MDMNLANAKELDGEWTELILTARKLGISIEEIRAFLRSASDRGTQIYTAAAGSSQDIT